MKPRSPTTIEPRDVGRNELDQICADALSYLAEEPTRLERFFDLTGLTVATLRQAVAEPGFAAQVVDYMTDEPGRLHAFAAAKGYDADAIEAIRLGLLPRDVEA